MMTVWEFAVCEDFGVSVGGVGACNGTVVGAIAPAPSPSFPGNTIGAAVGAVDADTLSTEATILLTETGPEDTIPIPFTALISPMRADFIDGDELIVDCILFTLTPAGGLIVVVAATEAADNDTSTCSIPTLASLATVRIIASLTSAIIDELAASCA